MVKYYLDFGCGGMVCSWLKRPDYMFIDDAVARCIAQAMKKYLGRDDVSVVARIEQYENEKVMGTAEIFVEDRPVYAGIFVIHAYETDEDIMELHDGWMEFYPVGGVEND